MILGYLGIVLTGLAWTAIAIIVSEGRRQQCPVPLFYAIGSLVAVLILTVLIRIDGLRLIFAPETRMAVICFVAGSVLNGTGQGISMLNLQKGGRALAYSIPQQGFLFPYIWSLFFWNQKLSWVSAVGILLICLSIFHLSMAKNTESSASLSGKRVLVALLAMCFLGSSQILTITPTRFEASATLPVLPATWTILATSTLFFACWCLVGRVDVRTRLKHSLGMGCLWGLVAVASNSALLATLNVLGKVSQSGIVFPAAVGILILLFTIFTIICYREKQNTQQKLAMVVIVVGIFMTKLG